MSFGHTGRGLLTLVALASAGSASPALAQSACVGERCHASLTEGAAVLHPPAAPLSYRRTPTSGDCPSCHEVDPERHPGAGEASFTLRRGGSPALCYGCHPSHDPGTGAVAKGRHQGLAEVNCLLCHAPHGSGARKLLRSRSLEQYFTAVEVADFELCWGCHDPRLVTEWETCRATGFRNGQENLHARHVLDPRVKRSCKTCHAAHSGQQRALIQDRSRLWVGYRWPLNLTPTPTGGRCVVGCHKPRSYDRVDPVLY